MSAVAMLHARAEPPEPELICVKPRKTGLDLTREARFVRNGGYRGKGWSQPEPVVVPQAPKPSSFVPRATGSPHPRAAVVIAEP